MYKGPKKGCNGCARLMKVAPVNNNRRYASKGVGTPHHFEDSDNRYFCTSTQGFLYIIDEDWYLENNCTEKTNEFLLKDCRK